MIQEWIEILEDVFEQEEELGTELVLVHLFALKLVQKYGRILAIVSIRKWLVQSLMLGLIVVCKSITGETDRKAVSTIDNLRKLLPPECIAELSMYRKRLISEQQASWVIRLKILWWILDMIWGVHIEAKWDNLWLHRSSIQKSDD